MPKAHLPHPDDLIRQAEALASHQQRQENWWEFCPMCSSKLINQKCRFVCSDPECQFFMSCSEFDL